MRVLILGGTGLISTSITRQLVERGDDVTLFNRGQRERRVPDGVKVITGDRKDYTAFESRVAAETWDGEGHRFPERRGRDGDFQCHRHAGHLRGKPSDDRAITLSASGGAVAKVRRRHSCAGQEN